MLDIFNKKSLSQAQTALANAEAKAQAQAKKTKQAAIIGGSTTGAAAAVACICFFTGGRKANREKIKNFNSVVEERNKSLDEIVTLKAKCDHAEALAIAADGCCCKMSAAFESNDPAEINAARQGHAKIHASIFGDVSQESVDAAVKAYDEFIKQTQNPAPQQKNDPAPQQKNDPAPQQKNDPAPQQKNDQLADAQAKYDAACKKAGDTKTALENAEKKLVAAKASAPDGDHKDLEAAVNTAKAAFDAADKELVDADAALKALQANQQK